MSICDRELEYPWIGWRALHITTGQNPRTAALTAFHCACNILMSGVNSQGIAIAVLILYALTIGKSHGAPPVVELVGQRRPLEQSPELSSQNRSHTLAGK